MIKWLFLVLASCGGAGGCKSHKVAGSDDNTSETTGMVASPGSSVAPSVVERSSREPVEAPRRLRFPERQRLALGAAQTCFVDASDALFCWGGNLFGEVGNATHGWTGSLEEIRNPASYVTAPVRVLARGVHSIAAWRGRSFAVDREGRLSAWGVDVGREVDGHRFIDRPLPEPTPAPVVRVAPAAPCVLGRNGAAYCARELESKPSATKEEGALGYHAFKEVPELGSGLLDLAATEASACAVKSDHSVWCWGKNDYGQLGRPKGPPEAIPREVPGLSARQIVAGHYHFCVVSPKREALCWGQANHHQLGNAERVMGGLSSPQRVTLPGPVVQLAANAGTTLALLEDGSVYAWGEGFYGLLARAGSDESSSVPVRIEGLGTVVQIGVGTGHACALREDDSVWCWGQGDDYQLGGGNNEDSRAPVRVVFP